MGINTMKQKYRKLRTKAHNFKQCVLDEFSARDNQWLRRAAHAPPMLR